MQKLVDEQHRRMLTGHAPAEEETEATDTAKAADADSKAALILQPKTFPLLYVSSSSGGANSYVPVEVGDIPKFSELSLTRVCGGSCGGGGGRVVVRLAFICPQYVQRCKIRIKISPQVPNSIKFVPHILTHTL